MMMTMKMMFNRRGRPTYFTQRAHCGCFDWQSSFHFSDCSGFAIDDEYDDKYDDEYDDDNDDRHEVSYRLYFRLSRLVRYAGQWEEVFVSHHDHHGRHDNDHYHNDHYDPGSQW